MRSCPFLPVDIAVALSKRELSLPDTAFEVEHAVLKGAPSDSAV